jgi:hypothetical protein
MRLTVGKTGKTGRGVSGVEERVTKSRLAPALKDLVVCESPIRAARGLSDERAGALPAYPSTRLKRRLPGAPRPTTYACARVCTRHGTAEPRISRNKGD